MPLEAFKVPETRLLAINELVVQITLTFRTDEDEELHYRYDQDGELQALVQTAVVSLVNCGYTIGVAKGPGFLLHQVRKKWPIGRRYIFTKDGEPMQSSLHKYFFQLEFIDDAVAGDVPVIEIAELRGVGLSPSASSYNGSVIEGLESVTLPPMAAMFGSSPPSFLESGDLYGHRRSGSALSGYSAASHRVNEGYERRSSSRLSLRDAGGEGSVGSYGRQRNLYQDAASAREHYRNAKGLATAGPSSVAQYVQYYSPRQAVDEQPGGGADNGGVDMSETQSPVTVAMGTRSVSRSSVGSVQTMQSVSEIAAAGSQQKADGDVGDGPGSGVRLGRSSWYRSLHGISPLSRQPKSLSSEAEFVGSGDAKAHESRIPRVAGALPGSRVAGAREEGASGLGGIAGRIKRKLLTPMLIHRQRRSLARQPPVAEGSDVDTSDFTGSEDGSALGDSSAAAAQHRRRLSSTDASLVSTSPSLLATPPGVSRPDMPPPSTRPPGRAFSRAEGEVTSIPTAVKNALLRRLRSPVGGQPDKSASVISVRDKITAFNSLSVDSTPTRRPSSSASASSNAGRLSLDGVAPSAAATPGGPRVRVGTATGFISMRPPSRASSVRSARPASPALSLASNVSTRIQETISALERAAAGGSPHVDGPVERSAAKRGAASADALEELRSPTKRPRAPSHANDVRRSSGR
ncbi:hypothetical protein H4S07_001134 [Coemansia furcata]|uniref:Uncharacterized protein n=1 Tax=Coemansia furcata TaxID=417177 RepID=A0ACC1LP47_9FUNG|nr:hypothetical protein H4S07_001134 [Coemansia furcata]